MTCNDCISNDVCTLHLAEFGGAENCTYFQNKVDVQELKRGKGVERERMAITTTVDIMGTPYKIVRKTYSEDEAFERSNIDGYCNGATKEIVYCDLSTYKGWEHEDSNTVRLSEMSTLRHEIVHAFFNESGLSDCSFTYDGPWAKNEEMVDWFAANGEKIYNAWKSAGVV